MEDLKKSEDKLQFEIIAWFRNGYCLKFHKPRYCIFSVPNDGQNVVEQMRKKSMGLLRGVSDLIVLLEKICLFIEVKTVTGTQSDNQKEFQEQVEELGFDYYLVRSLDEFKTIIQKYITL